MPNRPSIHNFRPHFKPLGFRSPRWQKVHSVLHRPALASRYMLARFRSLFRNQDKVK